MLNIKFILFLFPVLFAFCSSPTHLETRALPVEKSITLDEQSAARLIMVTQHLNELKQLAKMATIRTPSEDIYNFSVHTINFSEELRTDVVEVSQDFGLELNKTGWMKKSNHLDVLKKCRKTKFDSAYLACALEKQEIVLRLLKEFKNHSEVEELTDYTQMFADKIAKEKERSEKLSEYIDEYASIN